ncbi:MAG TPA: hypothetical protein P5277_00755 [Candidatus Paceibacterota bacterium]|nr:hypothetical protein [Candidatus Paceibacterota bacterium]
MTTLKASKYLYVPLFVASFARSCDEPFLDREEKLKYHFLPMSLGLVASFGCGLGCGLCFYDNIVNTENLFGAAFCGIGLITNISSVLYEFYRSAKLKIEESENNKKISK